MTTENHADVGVTRAQVEKLLAEGRTHRSIARELGLSNGTVSFHVRNIRTAATAGQPIRPAVPTGFEVDNVSSQVNAAGELERQWINARIAGDSNPELVPAGHVIKGLSTLIDESGAMRAQWVKTTRDQYLAQLAQDAALRALAEQLDPLPEIAAPARVDTRLCTQYTITDAHVGMLAWGREAGEPWDLHIAERVLTQTFMEMIVAAPPSRIGIVNQLGDCVHFDSLKPVTPEHGHLLDADSRYQKVVEVTVRILRRIVDAALAKHDEVVVYMHEGNHDPAGSVWLRVLFAALYGQNPRVRVEQSPLPYVAFRHGKVMLCYHHGHLARLQDLPLLFAARFAEMWGATSYRYIHSGHKHHVDEKEYPGVKVIQHPTLAAADAYAARGGWFAQRQATSMTYDSEEGEIARGIFVPRGLARPD